MKRRSGIDRVSNNLKNCFGFNENEISPTIWNDSSTLNDTSAPLVFQPDKPYRLALYVRPSQQRIVQKTNASLLVKNVMEKQMKNKKNVNSTLRPVEEKVDNSKGRKKTKKVDNVKLFEENNENIAKNTRRAAAEKSKLEKEATVMEVTSSRKNILRESNTKPLTKSKQIKIRRSYERKFKEKETENIPEPPSDQIIKDLEVKKLSRTKQKKTNKEDEEFEKWAKNINSDFNDVDKFELSIAYD